MLRAYQAAGPSSSTSNLVRNLKSSYTVEVFSSSSLREPSKKEQARGLIVAQSTS